jgi:hypothetical protein
MNIDHIRQRLRSVGAKPAHQALVLRNWTRALPLDLGRSRPEDFFPLELCAHLPGLAEECAGSCACAAEHAGEDGCRLLLALADGQTVESVLLPGRPVRVDPGRLRGGLHLLHDRGATACCASWAAPRSSPRWRSPAASCGR